MQFESLDPCLTTKIFWFGIFNGINKIEVSHESYCFFPMIHHLNRTFFWIFFRYVMDELGSALRHSDEPNFRVAPFLFMPEGNLASAVRLSSRFSLIFVL